LYLPNKQTTLLHEYTFKICAFFLQYSLTSINV
jgi:hypothetical protein